MLVFFSARRLKPGAWDQFRQAWEGDGEHPPGLKSVYHARNIRDEDEVISFGIFDLTKDGYHEWRGANEAQENARVDALSAFVENEHAAGVYEVIEEISE